jgi:thioredoxin-related protein
MRLKITIFILAGFLSSFIMTQASDKVKWYSFEEAVQLATKSPRKILVDIYTDWCGFCQQMDAVTFKNPQVAKYINEHYYPVKFNSETNDTIYFQGHMFVNDGEGRRSAHQLSIALLQGQMSYPSVVYIDEEFALLTSVPGFRKPDQIEPILRFFAEDHYKTKTWDEFMSNFAGTFK